MLTDKQQRFCEEYLIDQNATRAYKDAYGVKSDNVAGASAAKLLRNAKISTYIEEKQAVVSEELELTYKWSLNRFKEISDRCMQAEPVMIRDSEGELVPSGEYRFDSNGANKATENIAKLLGHYEIHNKQKNPGEGVKRPTIKLPGGVIVDL